MSRNAPDRRSDSLLFERRNAVPALLANTDVVFLGRTISSSDE